jgi:hypothetical protein
MASISMDAEEAELLSRLEALRMKKQHVVVEESRKETSCLDIPASLDTNVVESPLLLPSSVYTYNQHVNVNYDKQNGILTFDQKGYIAGLIYARPQGFHTCWHRFVLIFMCGPVVAKSKYN